MVRFQLRPTAELRTARGCTCSYCRMRGSVAVSADLDGLRITGGQDRFGVYRFNTKTAEHWSCSVCGIYTHHRRRSNPRQFGINVACLDGVSPFDFVEVPVNDGVNHPSDGAAGPRLAGVLRFIPAG